MLLNPCQKRSEAVYRPRRPEKTDLFKVIKKHYQTWKQQATHPIKKHVEKVFEKYLQCGNPAYGFACAHCSCCNTNFFIPFSCKGRGLCPSCNARTMAATAAHLVDNVIPLVKTRQWVISFPFCIRNYLLQHSHLQNVLQIVIEEIRKTIIASSPDIPNAQIGAVSFFHNFGSTLNLHPHFHLIAAEGVFSLEGEMLQFNETHISNGDIKITEERICKGVLRYFGKRKCLSTTEIEKILAKENSGFSLDGSVQIQSWDRPGLERVIRYCARAPFASESLRWNGKHVVYNLSKPNSKGQTSIRFDPVEFIDKIASLIPIPCRHRRHYFGVFAPNSPLRQQVIANAKRLPENFIPPPLKFIAEKVNKASLEWAALIARIYEVNPLICSKCGGKVKIIGFVTHKMEIHRILNGVGWPIQFNEFDPPQDFPEWEICQLIPGTVDGFPEECYSNPPYWESCSDPPHWESCSDPPHWEGCSDPLHWDNYSDPPHECD